MLKHLYIKNFALIDTLDIDFSNGFSVITGETGAGKSIILGAINLLLGERADLKLIKSGCDKCIIEAHFDLSKYEMEPFFSENDIEYDATDCILRRELTASGKSRAFVNDTPVTLSLIRKLGQQLIDIHSQHQNLLLSTEDFQLNVLDIIAQDTKQKDDYTKAYSELQDVRRAISKVRTEIEKSVENEEFIRFQLKELEEINLEPDMQQRFEAEAETLNHIEDIKTSLFEADSILNGRDDEGTVSKIKEAARHIESIKELFPDIKQPAERLSACYIELKDIAQDISSHTEAVDFDPERLQTVNEQLDIIYSLEQKHHTDSVENLIAIRDRLKEQVSNIDNSDVRLQELLEAEQQSTDKCTKKAAVLSSTRAKAARIVEEGMKKRLVPLGIPNVKFSICIDQKDFSDDGSDKVAFLFSANTNSPLQPVSQVASGGEIARVMLSLKAMISSAVKLPTIIFDEIDTGVSGKIAEKMALIMQEMAQADRQVISITHLPQIAAKGTSHYKVFKEDTDGQTSSRMVLLNDEERIGEIAQMLSGASVTEAALHNAKDLLYKPNL